MQGSVLQCLEAYSCEQAFSVMDINESKLRSKLTDKQNQFLESLQAILSLICLN